jgi:hypothetical protein
LTKGTGKYLPSVVASNTIVVLEYTSIQGRLFSLVVIRGQIVLLLFQCVNSLQNRPSGAHTHLSQSVSSYTYAGYLNSITVQNPYLKKAVFLLSELVFIRNDVTCNGDQANWVLPLPLSKSHSFLSTKLELLRTIYNT